MDTNTTIRQAVEAIKQGNKSNARTLLEPIVKNDSNNEEAWFLLAHVAQTPEQARTYLERVISINPNNERAKQQLQKLHTISPNKQPVAQTVRTKENTAVLYIMLGGIIVLLLTVVLLLAGIWLKDSPTANTSTSTWEYFSVSVHCQGLVPNKYVCTEMNEGWDQIPFNQWISLGEYADKYGKDGWELMSMTKNEGDILSPETLVLVFKRRVQ